MSSKIDLYGVGDDITADVKKEITAVKDATEAEIKK
jgi:hypothetical protein